MKGKKYMTRNATHADVALVLKLFFPTSLNDHVLEPS